MAMYIYDTDGNEICSVREPFSHNLEGGNEIELVDNNNFFDVCISNDKFEVCLTYSTAFKLAKAILGKVTINDLLRRTW